MAQRFLLLFYHTPLLFTAIYFVVYTFSRFIIYLSSQGLLGWYDLREWYLRTKRFKDWTGDEVEHVVVRLLRDMMLVGIFILQHSLMASDYFKAFLDNTFRIYTSSRLLYILATSLALQTLMTNWISTPEIALWQVDTGESFALSLFFYVLHGLCWIIIILQCACMDPLELLGIKQVYFFHKGRDPPLSYETFELQTFYRHLRHAGATCLWIILWVHPYMTLDRLLLALLFSFYLKSRHPVSRTDYKFAKEYFYVGGYYTYTYPVRSKRN